MHSTLAYCMAGETRTVIFVAAVLALMIIIQVLAVFWALKWGLGRQHPSLVGEDAEEGGGGRSAAGLSAEEVSELPCHEFKEGDGGECAVCLEAFRAGDRCRVLPSCKHDFHAECVDSWLRKSRRCPTCRAEVVAHGKSAGIVAEAAACLEIVTGR